MELHIDTRERQLITTLSKYLQRYLTKYPTLRLEPKIQTLPLGDIVFQRIGDTSPSLVIERKTVSDLKASICDGRAREQKYRLKANYPLERLLYLIEGDLDLELGSSVEQIPVDTLIGSLINTQLRDGIRVYKTASMSETVYLLVKLWRKLETDQNEFFNYTTPSATPPTGAEYASVLKKTKKENLTPSICYQLQLTAIPGVTDDIARAVIQKYPTLVELIAMYQQIPEELRPSLLQSIAFTTKAGHTRKVGPAVSKRVHNFLHGISESGTDSEPPPTPVKNQSKRPVQKKPSTISTSSLLAHHTAHTS